MRSAQKGALIGLALLTYGSLGFGGGFAWYWRSATYRNSCATLLSTMLELPADIGRVVPRSTRAREFQDVRIWLPQRRDLAASFANSLVRLTPRPDDPEAYEIDVRGGRCEISTRTWLRGDYRSILESSLRPGFDPAGPRRVIFDGVDVRFERDGFEASLAGASGVVTFGLPATGRATVSCDTFNGRATSEPVTLFAEFSPTADGVLLERVRLAVPEMPIAVVGLERLAGVGLKSGRFGGELRYAERDHLRELAIRGRVLDVPLRECTAPYFGEGWRGVASRLDLDELVLINGIPVRLGFRGVLTGVVLGDVLAPLGLPQAGGAMTVRVTDAQLSLRGVEHLAASGACDSISLEELSRAAGFGRITGNARVRIDDLTLEHNRLRSLDASIIVDAPPPEAPYWIERDLVLYVVQRTVGEPAAPWVRLLVEQLPERIPYRELGVRLEVRDEQLYVFGTHGQGERAILSLDVGGQPVPVLMQPAEPYDLQPWLDQARARLSEQVVARARSVLSDAAWEAVASLAQSQPSRAVGPEPPPDPSE